MEHAFELLITYKYFILFPLAIVEGPLITVIAGFLCSIGLLNPFIAYFIIIVADIIGDSLFYALGRWGRSAFLERVSRWLGLTPRRLVRIKTYMGANSFKTLALSKVILGIGVAGLYLAGRSKIAYTRFFSVCALTSLVQCGAYLLIGWFFGAFYQKISQYLDYFASLAIVIGLAFFLFFVIKSKINKV